MSSNDSARSPLEDNGNDRITREESTRPAKTARVSQSPEAAPKKVPTNTVCRFLVRNLSSRGRYGKADYHLDLVVDKHGLFDLVVKVFDILNSTEKITTDRCYSHLWALHFNKVKYDNGWRGNDHHLSFQGPMNHIDDEEPRIVADLKNLAAGQTGRFRGESASFDFVVIDTNYRDDTSTIAAAGNPSSSGTAEESSYPRATAVPCVLSGVAEGDWITSNAAMFQQAIDLRHQMQAYMQSDTSTWRRSREYDNYGWYRCKPLAPDWEHHETSIMVLLIQAECKFTESWNSILQYCFPNRAKTATSGQWYMCRRRTLSHYRYCEERSSMDNADRVRLAKRKARALLQYALERGVPSSAHPWATTIAKLSEQGLITDDMDPYERERIIYRHHDCF